MSAYIQAVESELDGLEYVSVGHIPHDTCSECPEEQNENVGDEGFFSWSACDCCRSSLGGIRYAAHGKDSEGNPVHTDVCSDCLVYIANGEEWHD